MLIGIQKELLKKLEGTEGSDATNQRIGAVFLEMVWCSLLNSSLVSLPQNLQYLRLQHDDLHEDDSKPKREKQKVCQFFAGKMLADPLTQTPGRIPEAGVQWTGNGRLPDQTDSEDYKIPASFEGKLSR